MDDYSRMMETEREIAREEAEWQTLKIEEMRVFSEQTFGVDFHDQLRKTARNTTFFSLFQKEWGIFVSKKSIISNIVQCNNSSVKCRC